MLLIRNSNWTSYRHVAVARVHDVNIGNITRLIARNLQNCNGDFAVNGYPIPFEIQPSKIYLLLFAAPMQQFITGFLIKRNLIKPRFFSSILKPTRFSSSDYLLPDPIRARVSYPLTDISSREIVILGLGAGRTMATQSNQPQSVHDFTVKVSFFRFLLLILR